LCHHVYPRNVAGVEEFPVALERIRRQIQQFVLLYPAQGAGPYRTTTVVSTQSLIQKGLAETP
jgi:hypothetical protein